MDHFTDDAILSLATYLLPQDLFCLALTCKRFGRTFDNDERYGNYANTECGDIAHQLAEEGGRWSLMEEAARQKVVAAKQFEWKDSDLLLSRRDGTESWIAVYHRLHLLQTSLAFHRLVGNGIGYVNGRDPSHVEIHEEALNSGQYPLGSSCAICQEVMKSGRHYAEFTVTREGYIELGIMRPMEGWDTRELKTMHPMCSGDFKEFCTQQQRQNHLGYEGDIHCYLYTTPTDSYGRSNFLRENDIVGFSLNLDTGEQGGTLTVYKNGRCLGVKKEGLSGHYCWVVSITNAVYRGAVRIASEMK